MMEVISSNGEEGLTKVVSIVVEAEVEGVDLTNKIINKR